MAWMLKIPFKSFREGRGRVGSDSGLASNPAASTEVPFVEQGSMTPNETLVSRDIGSIAQAGLPVVGNELSHSPIVVEHAAERPFQVQPLFRGDFIHLAGASTGLDLTHLIPGTRATIFARGGDKVFAGNGRNFLGRSDAEPGESGYLRATGRSLFEVREFGGNRSVVHVDGPAPVYGSEIIKYDHMIVGGGQSNMYRMWGNYGIGGFTLGMAQNVSPVQRLSFQFVNGATGGTAIDKRSVVSGEARYWWDSRERIPGPALNTFMNAVARAVDETGLVPRWTFWTQGESDVEALCSGTLTTQEMMSSIRATFEYIRSVYPEMRFVINSIGSHDRKSADSGANAARVAYLKIIESEEYCYRGVDLYDLPRRVEDIHLMAKAYAIKGARLANVWANLALGQDNPVAPQVVDAKLEDKRTVRLTISGGSLYSPEAVIYGERPCGIYALPGGADATAEPIALYSAHVEQNTVVVRGKSDLTGCQIGGPYGWVDNARVGVWFRDRVRNEYHDWAGSPLASFLMNVRG